MTNNLSTRSSNTRMARITCGFVLLLAGSVGTLALGPSAEAVPVCLPGIRIVIHGTPGNDVINASDCDEDIYGLGGNDIINGFGGDDFIDGGEGSDQLYGQDGDDVLWGGDNDDTIHGGDGDDIISGGDGVDTVVGGRGFDTCTDCYAEAARVEYP